jgi:hypothetical protein
MNEAPEREFMKDWHANMSTALLPLLAPRAEGDTGPRSGVFAAACYMHGGFTHSGPFINGINFYEAFGNFYFERTGEEAYKLSDDCGEMCNPTCPS